MVWRYSPPPTLCSLPTNENPPRVSVAYVPNLVWLMRKATLRRHDAIRVPAQACTYYVGTRISGGELCYHVSTPFLFLLCDTLLRNTVPCAYWVFPTHCCKCNLQSDRCTFSKCLSLWHNMFELMENTSHPQKCLFLIMACVFCVFLQYWWLNVFGLCVRCSVIDKKRHPIQRHLCSLILFPMRAPARRMQISARHWHPHLCFTSLPALLEGSSSPGGAWILYPNRTGFLLKNAAGYCGVRVRDPKKETWKSGSNCCRCLQRWDIIFMLFVSFLIDLLWSISWLVINNRQLNLQTSYFLHCASMCKWKVLLFLIRTFYHYSVSPGFFLLHYH